MSIPDFHAHSHYSWKNAELQKDADGTLYFHFMDEARAQEGFTGPFLQGYQKDTSDGKCSFYALNAYLGFHIPLPRFVAALVEYLLVNRGVANEQEAKALLHPALEEGWDESNLLDVDMQMLMGAIEILADQGVISPSQRDVQFLPFDLADQAWESIHAVMLGKLFHCDRFILGIASPFENHLIAWRKDKKNDWWKIDSLSREQTCYTLEEALKEIKSAYGTYPKGHLYFLLPVPSQAKV